MPNENNRIPFTASDNLSGNFLCCKCGSLSPATVCAYKQLHFLGCCLSHDFLPFLHLHTFLCRCVFYVFFQKRGNCKAYTHSAVSIHINLFLNSLMPCYVICLSAPRSVCVLALFECGLGNEFTIFIVNPNLCFVVVHPAFFACGIDICLGGLRYRGLICGCLLR